MKNIVGNFIRTIVSFVKMHTAVSVAIASVIVVTAVAVPVGIHIANNDNTIQLAPSQIIETDEDVVSSKEEIAEPVSSETTADSVVLQEETPTDELITSQQEETAPKTQPPKNEPADTPASNPVNKPSSSTSSSQTVMQIADPDTGVSWDGKSQIVYTYTDGTTGSEMKLGATYERLPGMTTTIIESDLPNWQPEEYSPHCENCGNLMGDGTNGTCLSYWTGGDHACPNCGETVPQKTCHSCDN